MKKYSGLILFLVVVVFGVVILETTDVFAQTVPSDFKGNKTDITTKIKEILGEVVDITIYAAFAWGVIGMANGAIKHGMNNEQEGRTAFIAGIKCVAITSFVFAIVNFIAS